MTSQQKVHTFKQKGGRRWKIEKRTKEYWTQWKGLFVVCGRQNSKMAPKIHPPLHGTSYLGP